MQTALLKFSEKLKYKLSYEGTEIYFDENDNQFVFHSMGHIKRFSTLPECKENIDLCINHSPGRNHLYNKELRLMEDLYRVRQQIGILE